MGPGDWLAILCVGNWNSMFIETPSLKETEEDTSGLYMHRCQAFGDSMALLLVPSHTASLSSLPQPGLSLGQL